MDSYTTFFYITCCSTDRSLAYFRGEDRLNVIRPGTWHFFTSSTPPQYREAPLRTLRDVEALLMPHVEIHVLIYDHVLGLALAARRPAPTVPPEFSGDCLQLTDFLSGCSCRRIWFKRRGSLEIRCTPSWLSSPTAHPSAMSAPATQPTVAHNAFSVWQPSFGIVSSTWASELIHYLANRWVSSRRAISHPPLHL